jgi:hypothetical protein
MTGMEDAESAVAYVGIVFDSVKWEVILSRLAHWQTGDFAVQVKAQHMHKPMVVASKMNMMNYGLSSAARSFQDHRPESLEMTDSGRACD